MNRNVSNLSKRSGPDENLLKLLSRRLLIIYVSTCVPLYLAKLFSRGENMIFFTNVFQRRSLLDYVSM